MQTDPAGALEALTSAPRVDDQLAIRAVSLLLVDPASSAFLLVEEEVLDDAEPAATPLQYLVPHTRIFVNRAIARDLRGDVAVALAAWAATQSVSVATCLALLRRAVQAVKILDEASLDLIVVVASASAARAGDAATWADLASAYDGRTDDLRKRLDELVERKILLHVALGWQVAP